MTNWLRFILSVLAVWRITHLLAKEEGPWGIVASLRRNLGKGIWGQLLDCFKCLSLWVAVPFVFFVGGNTIEKIVLWLALSGGAIFLEEYFNEPLIIEQGEKDELLRSERDENDPQDQKGNE